MIINTEWGGFDNERRIMKFTTFDNKVDRESINPRKQAFEKMISGMYLGEIARNVFLHLIDSSILFQSYSSTALNEHYGFDTALMSSIESLPVPEPLAYQGIKKIFTDIGVPSSVITDEDCLIAYRVCEIVATRAARLSACAVAAIVLQTGNEQTNDPIGVGVDGSVVEHYPNFEQRVRKALVELLGEGVEKRISIGLAKDGSGVGAALCALQAKKQRETAASL